MTRKCPVIHLFSADLQTHGAFQKTPSQPLLLSQLLHMGKTFLSCALGPRRHECSPLVIPATHNDLNLTLFQTPS